MADEEWHAAARRKLDGKTKPKGSLGVLEDWAVRLAGRQGTLDPEVAAPRLVVFAADHGVAAAHSVSTVPASVTIPIFQSIAAGAAACCVIARSVGASVELVNAGIAVPPSHTAIPLPKRAPDISVRDEGIKRGTADLVAGPAMTAEDVQAALQLGRTAVRRAAAAGATVLCIGEIGIGNTTTAAALLSGLTGEAAEAVTGRGTGIDDTQLRNKQGVVANAVARAWAAIKHERKELMPSQELLPPAGIGSLNASGAADAASGGSGAEGDACSAPRCQPGDRGGATGKHSAAEGGSSDAESATRAAASAVTVALLRHLGGLEICAMAGAMLEAQSGQMLIVVDGFVSGVAALAALCIAPAAARGLVLSHRSAEHGAAVLLDALARVGAGVEHVPMDMRMRLGEGTGALLMLPLLHAAAAVLKDMGTLEDTLALGALSS